MTRVTASAPAKVNLFLHVLGRRADGRHELESLVGFADVGDRLEIDVEPAADRAREGESIVAAGPFAEALQDALARGARLSVETAWEIVRAAAQPRRFNIEITLEKRLPVAAGIGGGTSDAAAALKALAAACELGWDEAELLVRARELGADGPACALARPLMMTGIGETVAPLAAWPDLDVVLVNPGRPVDTAAVFAAYAAAGEAFSPPHAPPPAAPDRAAALAYLAGTRNDLYAAARAVEPAVGAVAAELEGRNEVRLARLSGSGGTCWAAFDDADQAAAAAADIAARRPGWWVAATRVAGTTNAA